MAASVETEKDDGSSGGGSGAHVTQPAPPLSLTRAAYRGERIYELQNPACSAPPNRNAAGAGGRTAFWSLQSPKNSIVSVPTNL